MWEIWAKQLLPKALKSCPQSNKLPKLVTLIRYHNERYIRRFLLKIPEMSSPTTSVRSTSARSSCKPTPRRSSCNTSNVSSKPRKTFPGSQRPSSSGSSPAISCWSPRRVPSTRPCSGGSEPIRGIGVLSSQCCCSTYTFPSCLGMR